MSKKALLLVDVQYDFLPPDGALAVPNGDVILPHIYHLLDHADQYEVVVASMVGHPLSHVSFASVHSKAPFTEITIPKLRSRGQTSSQMLWPDHCVQETRGSSIEEGVKSRLDALGPDKVVYIRKGTHKDVDAYSAFADNEYTVFTPLAKVLFQHGVTEVDVVGLALDYCVNNTVIDSRKFGFTTRLLKKCTKAVDPASEPAVLETLQEEWGVKLIE